MTRLEVLLEGASDAPAVREILVRKFGLVEDKDFKLHPHRETNDTVIWRYRTIRFVEEALCKSALRLISLVSIKFPNWSSTPCNVKKRPVICSPRKWRTHVEAAMI